MGALIWRLWLSRRTLKTYKEKTITHVDSSCWFTMGRSWRMKPHWRRTRSPKMVFLLSCLARYIFPWFSIFLEVMCFYFAQIVYLTCFGFNMLIIYLKFWQTSVNSKDYLQLCESETHSYFRFFLINWPSCVHNLCTQSCPFLIKLLYYL